ncbi:MAG: hypothetical protein ABFD89_00990 [Bryobacteraceae bacterium]
MFTKYNFKIASLLPSSAGDRHANFSGLYVSPERTIETDGHQMVIVTRPESQSNLFSSPDGLEDAEYFTPFVMDRDTAIKLAKSMPKRDKDAPELGMALVDVHTEAESDSTVAITEDVRRVICKSAKGNAERFPMPEPILKPDDAARFEVRLSPDILAPLFQLFQGFCAFPSITIRLYDQYDPVQITAEGNDGQKMAALVMPLISVDGDDEAA